VPAHGMNNKAVETRPMYYITSTRIRIIWVTEYFWTWKKWPNANNFACFENTFSVQWEKAYYWKLFFVTERL